MIAVDTNIIIRFITRDDPDQFARVEALLGSNPVYVPKTVILEAEWVLRSSYRMPRDAIRDALAAFAGLLTVSLEDPHVVHAALASSLDLADALHLASGGAARRFATFDQALIDKARQDDNRQMDVFEP